MIKTTLLKNIFLFHDLDDESLEYIADQSSLIEVNKNKILFSKGDTASSIFVIIRGKVKIFNIAPDGGEHIIHIHKEGDILAEAAVFDLGIYPAFCIALEDSKLINISKETLVSLITKRPETALKFMASYSKRLRQFVEKVDHLAQSDVKQRLINYIIQNMHKEDNFFVCEIPSTKKELASFLGTILETLSRNLNKLKKEADIVVEQKQIIINNPTKLKALMKL